MLQLRQKSSARIKIAVFSLLLLAVAVFLSYRISQNGLPRSTASATQPVQVGGGEVQESSIRLVKKGEIRKLLLLDGELRAVRYRLVYVSTPQEVKITYLAPEGSIVKPGDRLVELDSGVILQKIKDLEEKIVAADNEILKTRSAQESALRDMDVQLSRLWLSLEQATVRARPAADLIPLRDYQENQLALAKAKTEYANHLAKIGRTKEQQAAELQVKLIERKDLDGQLEEARRTLDGMNIKAPSEGMVIYNDHWSERRKIQVGDVVWAGLSVLQLPDLREMEIITQANEVDGPGVSVGQRADVTIDSYQNIKLAGTVREISQTAVKAGWMAKANVFRVVISLDFTPPGILKPGMSAQIALDIGGSDTQLLVPRQAVRFEKGSAEVLRIESDTVRRPVAVIVLMSDPFQFAVAPNGALKEGDRILVPWR